MGTKNNPAPFDCYANAEPDEPMFILLARDSVAADLVDAWADERIRAGKNRHSDPQIMEARGCAQAMRVWLARRRPA